MEVEMIIQPTRDVDANKWTDMSFDELMDQKYLLASRYEKVIGINKEIANEILKGIERLDVHIQKKVGNNGVTI